MKILDQPDELGYYWWRKRPGYRWHLAYFNEGTARFFNGGQISKDFGFWGEWVKAEIPEPSEEKP